jgi:hypothetical protein
LPRLLFQPGNAGNGAKSAPFAEILLARSLYRSFAMSSPRPTPHGGTVLEIQVVQLQAQVAALTDLLVECGVLDRSMLQGRLQGAAARVSPRPLGLAPKKPGLLWRIFKREEPRAPRADQTLPQVNLPFKPVALYDSERISERHLTTTEVGKCQRCWRIQPLSVARLCARCEA